MNNTTRELLKKKFKDLLLEIELRKFKTTGERLKYIRTKVAKKSRPAVAQDVGISAITIKKYEANETTLKIDKLILLANYYNVPLRLITMEDNKLNDSDMILISNLQQYCLEIQMNKYLINNKKEIQIGVCKANIQFLSYTRNLKNMESEYLYIADLLQIDTNKEVTLERLLSFLQYKLEDLNNPEKETQFNLDYQSRIFTFLICTLKVITKDQYNKTIHCLDPLIDSFKLNYNLKET